MAFQSGSPGTSAFGSAAAGSTNTQTGPELEEIQTEVGNCLAVALSLVLMDI